MKKTPFHLILVALAVSSCATARYYGGFMPEKVGQDMALVGPVSAIYYLDEKNHESFNDTLSTFSETLITNLIDEMGVPVSGRIELNDDEKEEAFAFLRYLSDQDDRRLDLFPIPGVLDEALEAQGYRYGLLLVARGMTRDAKEYAKEGTLKSDYDNVVFICGHTQREDEPIITETVMDLDCRRAFVLDTETGAVR